MDPYVIKKTIEHAKNNNMLVQCRTKTGDITNGEVINVTDTHDIIEIQIEGPHVMIIYGQGNMFSFDSANFISAQAAKAPAQAKMEEENI
jgi:hypothetical protein